jgi:hypothetical protein
MHDNAAAQELQFPPTSEAAAASGDSSLVQLATTAIATIMTTRIRRF